MSFEKLNLNNPLRNAIEDLNYLQPTPIQEQVFPVIMGGKDVIGLAQTGTGKTFAYLLPLLRNLKYSEQRYPRFLIVVPTRELVVQVVNELEKLTKYMSVRFMGVYGGKNMKTQGEQVYKGLDIIVGTPGRLMDLYMTGLLRFKSIQKVVVDEMDEMLAQGYRRQLVSLFELLPVRRQTMMFSATLSEDVEEIIEDFMHLPEKIVIAAHGTPLEKIDQQVFHVPNHNTKLNLLEHILNSNEDIEKALIFVGNRKLADKIHEDIVKKVDAEFGVIHSNKSQNYRLNAVKNFDEDKTKFLIATDIAARGLDFKGVTHVINFDTPEVPGDYIHRIGRTGRADKDGQAFSFVSEMEVEHIMLIEKLIKKAVPVTELPEELKISDVFLPDEKPVLFDKEYLPNVAKRSEGGAFHEKLEKNKKVNMGGSWKRKVKNKKLKKRSSSTKKRRS